MKKPSTIKQILATIYMVLAAFIFIACSEDNNINQTSKNENIYRIAIIAPSEMKKQWQATADWAIANIEKAQESLTDHIKIEYIWYDESIMKQRDIVQQIANDPTLSAVIGPVYSDNASTMMSQCYKSGMTLLLPTITSTELQRIYSGSENIWNMVQNDVAQLEILLSLAKGSGNKSVRLIAGKGIYGQSFTDWFGFAAAEFGQNIADLKIYDTTDDLRTYIKEMLNNKFLYNESIIFCPSSTEAAKIFADEMNQKKINDPFFSMPYILCTDAFCSYLQDLTSDYKLAFEGLELAPDPESGFELSYNLKFGSMPSNGEAHFYDCFLLLAYALTRSEVTGQDLNSAIRDVINGEEGSRHSWFPGDMSIAFQMLRQGFCPDVNGVSGKWNFDKSTYISPTDNVYRHWILHDNRFATMEYLSTDGSKRTGSSYDMWNWNNTKQQEFTYNDYNICYPELKEKYALIIATSSGWSNYRHQADAMSIYQLLKRYGYTDDHIILICQDDIANNDKNIYPGIMKVSPDGENVYSHEGIDYCLSDLTFDDLCSILSGEKSSRLPKVIESTENDNILIFWSGHGGIGGTLYWDNGFVRPESFKAQLEKMSEDKRFRKMMVVLETCYSGAVGKLCEGIHGTLFITAANPSETSKAAQKDIALGTWLSNGFTLGFREAITENPNISLRDLYYVLARNTSGSHTQIYNEQYYGSVFNNSAAEFFIK